VAGCENCKGHRRTSCGPFGSAIRAVIPVITSTMILPSWEGRNQATHPTHVYEVRPRKDKRGVDLISDALPFGRLWYGEPDAVSNAIGYAKFRSRSRAMS
jgi:hypothetical protein